MLITAIKARTYSADGPTNTRLQNEAIDRFRGATVFVRRMMPEKNIYTIDAFKGNVNGAITQSIWTLPGDVTAQPGGGNQLDGGIEYRRNWRLALASVAVYGWDGTQSLDTAIDVEFEIE